LFQHSAFNGLLAAPPLPNIRRFFLRVKVFHSSLEDIQAFSAFENSQKTGIDEQYPRRTRARERFYYSC
jgi:hypothetical protein